VLFQREERSGGWELYELLLIASCAEIVLGQGCSTQYTDMFQNFQTVVLPFDHRNFNSVIPRV
jgi:pyruvate/2-oxoacid:ferredoxin oxidoreductase beta subunit